MKKLRRILCFLIIIGVIATTALTSTATMHSNNNCSTANGSYTTNSGVTELVHWGSHTSCMKLRSVSYYGMPANTIPNNKSFTLSVANTNTSFTYSFVSTSYRTQSYSVSSDVTAYVGISNNSGSGCTAYYDWNPNY